MSSSQELAKRRSQAVSRGVSSMLSSYVDHAAGGHLTDVDGREWIDFGSGIAVTSVGNSAPKAVENAVKIARHYTGRSAIVVFDHAYHGRTNLTMALTAKNMPYKHRFGP